MQFFKGRVKEDKIAKEGVDHCHVEEHANCCGIHRLVQACDQVLLDPMAETCSDKFDPGKLAREAKHFVASPQNHYPDCT